MISVRSLLLLLNGNRVRYCLCSLILLFSLNSSSQVVAEDDDDKDAKEETKTPSADAIVNPYVHLDKLDSKPKDIYNIAFILPINASKISPGDGKTKSASMPIESREVLGFWEGVNIAFAKMKKMQTKFNYHIWDNMKDDSITSTVLDSLKNYSIDVIVAPFHTKQAMKVSEYSKSKKIPMFLAQNPSDLPARNNPYSFKFHVPKNRLFYDYYRKITNDISESTTQIYFVYDGSSKAEKKFANYLKFMAERDGTNRLRLLDYSSNPNLASQLDSSRKSLLMISYYKTAQVNEIIDKLLLLKTENIDIFGHNLWGNNLKINVEKLTRLHAKIYSDYYQRNNWTLGLEIKEKYTSMTGDHSVSDVYLGYDVAMYIANVIERYGSKFPISIDKYKYYGVVSNFHLKPSYDPEGRILFFENTSKFLLKAAKEGWISED